jgi:hypothetical protein
MGSVERQLHRRSQRGKGVASFPQCEGMSMLIKNGGAPKNRGGALPNFAYFCKSLDRRLDGKHDFNTLLLSGIGDLMSKPSQQETIQIKVSPRLKKEIRRSALESDETLRTFILKALRNRGVTISDDELIDRRKAVQG